MVAEPSFRISVAKQLANLFVDENLLRREVQAQGTSEFTQSQLEQARKSLDEQEAKVSRSKLQHNGRLPQQEAALQATLTRLQTELVGNQDAINRAQQNKVMLESSISVAEATS
jgi:polysaccharide biosynthesis transport protein